MHSARHSSALGLALFGCLAAACSSDAGDRSDFAAGGAFTGNGGSGLVAAGGANPGAGGVVQSFAGSSMGGSPGAGGTLVGGAGASGAPSGGASGAGGAGASGGAGGGGDCGNRTGQRGKTIRKLTVGSASRSYVAYLPQNLNPATPVPFVYVFHGASQNGSWLYDSTEYAKLADSEGIAVVFPDGQGASSQSLTGSLTPWNVSDGPGLCGLGTLVSNANPIDFAFVDAIKKDVLQDQCLDDEHVFATGFSMGGYFSHHIACDRPDFRAAAPHSGGTMASLDSCKTGHMPIIVFHGNADVLINNACDDPTATPQAGFPASATLWAKKNGCKDTYQTIPVKGTTSGDDGQCFLYDGCPADGQVEACIFTNLGHAWAGAPVCQGCIGAGAGWPSATQLEWAFFKKYAW